MVFVSLLKDTRDIMMLNWRSKINVNPCEGTRIHNNIRLCPC